MDDGTLARFMSKVEIQPNGCWYWRQPRKDGYGELSVGRAKRLAHVLAWEHFVGPVAEGHEVDHQCHNWHPTCRGGPTCQHRRCCNPEHLDATTRSINLTRRWRNKCKVGHPLTEDNVYVKPDGKRRQCLKCSRERDSARSHELHPGVRHGTETHCPQGHPYAGDNLYINPALNGRVCRTCKREQGREWMRAKRARDRAAKQ